MLHLRAGCDTRKKYGKRGAKARSGQVAFAGTFEVRLCAYVHIAGRTGGKTGLRSSSVEDVSSEIVSFGRLRVAYSLPLFLVLVRSEPRGAGQGVLASSEL